MSVRHQLTCLIIGVCLVVARPVLAADNWSLTAVGDIMLDRYVRQMMLKNGPLYPFSAIHDQLQNADLVVGNLEGPITTSSKHATAGGSLTFTFDPSTATALQQAGFTALSLANNHTLNFGERGLQSTRQYLQQAGIKPFGDPRNRSHFHLTQIINGQRITLLGYHGLVSGLETVLLDARRAHAKGETVIVFAHTGNEYALRFTARQQRDYRRLVDAGADLVIGSHPHVVQPLEIYHGKLIAYSLGNFVFDQYFSTDTQQQLMLQLQADTRRFAVQLVPLVSIRSQVRLAPAKLGQTVLNRLAQDSIVSTTQRQAIRSGVLTLTR